MLLYSELSIDNKWKMSRYCTTGWAEGSIRIAWLGPRSGDKPQSGISGFPKDLVLIGKSKHDFVDKLLYLKDENIRKTYGKKLRQEIEKNHNADIEIKKLISLYNELM